MNRVWSTFVASALVAFAFPSTAPSQKGPNATELQGTWNVVLYEQSGVRPKGMVGAQMVFDEDRFVFKDKMDKRYDDSGRFSLDTEKNPRHIDFISSDGAKVPGIWKRDGDILQICLNRSSVNLQNRPTIFDSREYIGEVVLVRLKRAK